VFSRSKLAVFVDGDFWHGRNWPSLEIKLSRGHNSSYWTRKIGSNIVRDREHDVALAIKGWSVMRFWESEVMVDLATVAQRIESVLGEQRWR
jgi:DNA mismatch endonuclease Vsr